MPDAKRAPRPHRARHAGNGTDSGKGGGRGGAALGGRQSSSSGKGAADRLIRRVLRRETAALSRALSVVTDETQGHERLSRAFFAYHGSSHKIGLCGPPGSGKSSLISRLVKGLRADGETVGVLAVDPSSPFTGGAFLGDRLRIQEHAGDDGVFMRSLASRGMMGGLNATIFGAIRAMEAYGFDRLLIETVGTGQDEVDIADVADTVVYVAAPYQGDEFQAMKAGAMEITDLFAVNKADLADVGRTVASLRESLALGQDAGDGWKARVAPLSAHTGTGIPEFLGLIDEHREYLRSGPEGRARTRRQLRRELALVMSRRIFREALSRDGDGHIEALLDKKSDPLTMGNKLIRDGGS